MRRPLGLCFALVVFASGASGCGGDDSPSLDDFLPPVPAADGTAQSVYAGPITAANAVELIDGPALTGRVGDFFMRNAKARFVIQAPTRTIGIVPWGGNVIDAVPLDASGDDLAEDHIGELGLVYVTGRTCGHERVEVLRDGSGGGPAVVRAIGRSQVNGYVNLRGIGALPYREQTDPDIPDFVECATTYVLEPDSDTLRVSWTLFNEGPTEVHGPFGTLSDTGGQDDVFTPEVGMAHLGQASNILASLGEEAPAAYAVYQGPGVAYGLIPVHEDPTTTNAAFVIAGASVIIYGALTLTDIFNEEDWILHLLPGEGRTFRMDFVVARDGVGVDAAYQTDRQVATTAVSGQVSYVGGDAGRGARVGVFRDTNGDSALDADDVVATYFETQADGTFSGALPAGTYFVRADVTDVARSQVETVDVAAAAVTVPTLSLPAPAKVAYTVTDAISGQPIPAKITVVGRHPAARDPRLTETYDMRFGVVRHMFAPHGTSIAAGAGDLVDPELELPAGGPYRIYVTHGPEWSVASQVVTVAAGESLNLNFQLQHVVDTSGYVATEFHQHAVGSPDSPVGYTDRLASMVVEGIEFFASTDHDFLSDYDPYIQLMGLDTRVDAVVGVETTPFAYGHFNAYPLEVQLDEPNGGAVDWIQGSEVGAEFALTPAEIWRKLHERGADIVHVCHPRSKGFGSFQAYFDRAALTFDFNARTFYGQTQSQAVPQEWLRLPNERELFADSFDALETWNGFGTVDSNDDGVREFENSDAALRDWMNFLSFGKFYPTLGNSDTHTMYSDPAGLPRTLVKALDADGGALDDADGIASGALADAVFGTMLGVGGRARDMVVTNGPMIAVSADGGTTSALGKTIAATADTVTLSITVTAPAWVDFDTVEVFANSTFDRVTSSTGSAMTPTLCYTTRTIDATANDVCERAALGAQPMTVLLLGTGTDDVKTRTAILTVTIDKAAIPRRTGAVGDDVWVSVRVRGDKALYPVLSGEVITEANLDTLVSGTPAEIDAALRGKGAFATAYSAPVFIDFDGGGWRGQFQP